MKNEKLFMTLLICSGVLMIFGIVCIINLKGTAYNNLWANQELKQQNENNNNNSTTIPTHKDLPPLNVLLLGLDKDGCRTDVLLLASYDPNRKIVNLLSIPRDTKVYYNGTAHKINSLYGKQEEKSVKAKIEEMTGLRIRYFVTVDFIGFRKLVDAFGGVKIDVPTDLKYDDPYQDLHINLKKGIQILDGNKAEQFVRFRKGNSSTEGYNGGDIMRINSQQIFITEFIKQKANMKYISHADKLFDILFKYVKTDVDFSTISPYISQILNMHDISIKSHVLPGISSMSNDVWYFVYDKNATKKVIGEF